MREFWQDKVSLFGIMDGQGRPFFDRVMIKTGKVVTFLTIRYDYP
jgi:hypothetical protein